MIPGAAEAPEKAGMKLIEANVPELYSPKSIAYVAVLSLAPIVVAHLINLLGWWAPLLSAIAWNVL